MVFDRTGGTKRVFDFPPALSVHSSKMRLRSRRLEYMFDGTSDEGNEPMLTVQNDWIEYESTQVRRAAVRGGATCATRIPVISSRTGPRANPPWSVEPLVFRAAAPPRGRPARRLRLTARGRLVLLVLPVFVLPVLLLLALLCVTSVPAPARAAEAAQGVRLPTAGPIGADDTLWTGARRVAPDRDTRGVVIEIERANNLADAGVPGQRLVVPVRTVGR